MDLPKDSVIGYVHNLSPLKKGNRTQWCDFDMQLANDKTVRVVCFSKNKRSLFEEKQNTITPVKISKYLIGPNFKGAGQEIRVNDMSVVQTPSSSEYNFQYKPDSDNSPVPLKNIDGDAYEDGLRLSIKGKITKGANVEVVGYKRLKMLNCAINDGSKT